MSLAKKFPNYMQVKKVIPDWVWHFSRVISFLCVVAICYFLYEKPKIGLFLFWGVFIPALPLMFFIAPGVWRNICPMASVNQLSRELKINKGIAAGKRFKEYSYVIAITLIYLIIPARKYLFSYNATSLLLLIIFMMLLAFIGGLFFKGKSGWCASMCPLLPFQQIYGQTPFINVRNYHCRPCVGCVENCYDFNPNISYLAMLYGSDKYSAGYRKFFVSSLPGLIIAFFTVPNPPLISIMSMYTAALSIIAISIAVYFILTTFVKIADTNIAILYGAISINLFYFFILPLLDAQYSAVFGINIPDFVYHIVYITIFSLSVVWLVRTYRKEQAFLGAVSEEKSLRIKSMAPVHEFEKKHMSNPVVTILPSNRRLVVNPGESLLEIMEAEKLPVQSGCRVGMCGADPVTILEGYENLDPPSEEEKATLLRLGVSERSRMACCARVKGPVTVSLQPELSHKVRVAQAEGAQFNFNNLVIIGNGVAGMTAAYHVNTIHPNCKITIIGRESHHYYNRMAIARLLESHSHISDISLLPKNWAIAPYAECWLNTIAMKIDREKKSVEIGIHEYVSYDKLIIATGSSSYIPPIENKNLKGCFKLREADDVIQIRKYIQEHDCHRVVISGGGLLGLEPAYEFSQYERFSVSIVERGPHLLMRQLDTRAAKYLHSYLEGLGIHIIVNAEVKKVIGKKRVVKVQVTDANQQNEKILNCDLLLICAGIKPNIQIAKECGLAVNRGVIVDSHMRTEDPDIYAIGDVAEVNGKIEGLWVSSMQQAKVASQHILGKETAYANVVPMTILKIAGIDVISMGVIEPRTDQDSVIIIENEREKTYRKLVISNNKIIGAILVGTKLYADDVHAAIENEIDVSAMMALLRSGDWKILTIKGMPKLSGS